MKTALRKSRIVAPVFGLKAVGDPSEGIFEAYVSIFGNTDYHGDRIKAGAFAGSLERWKASGDPIPVIFSHQWDDLDAHIGEVLEAEEHLPGDSRLPESIRANGGLWTKFSLELDEDFAARVAKKLTKRTIREFSFAYDVLDEAKGTDGVNELLELDVLEVGPTLKGANPATVLLAKALGELDEKALEIFRKTVAHAFAASDEDPTRCVLCGLTRNTVAHNALRAESDGKKSSVPVSFEGSIEDELESIFAAAHAWAAGGNIGNGGFYALHQEATFLEEGRVVVLVEGWEDPWGEGTFYELNFSKNEEGEVVVEDPHELEVSVDLTRKARAKKARHGAKGDVVVNVTVPGDAPAAPAPEPEAKDDDEPDEDELDAEVLDELALVELEELETVDA